MSLKVSGGANFWLILVWLEKFSPVNRDWGDKRGCVKGGNHWRRRRHLDLELDYKTFCCSRFCTDMLKHFWCSTCFNNNNTAEKKSIVREGHIVLWTDDEEKNWWGRSASLNKKVLFPALSEEATLNNNQCNAVNKFLQQLRRSSWCWSCTLSWSRYLQQNYCQDPPQVSPPPWATFDEEGKEAQAWPSYCCYWRSIVVMMMMIVMILVIVIVMLLLFSITILITVTDCLHLHHDQVRIILRPWERVDEW